MPNTGIRGNNGKVWDLQLNGFSDKDYLFKKAIAALLLGQEEQQEDKKKSHVADVSIEYFLLLDKQNREFGTFCAPDGSLRASEMFSSVIAFLLPREHFQQELCYLKRQVMKQESGVF